MGIYYDIFYDRNNPKKAYKIPYAGDYFENAPTIGKTDLKRVGETGNVYTYVTDYGEDSVPKGIECTKFFKQFGSDTYNNTIILLSGLDGGYDNDVRVATPYIHINRQHSTSAWGKNVYRSTFDFVALGGKFRFQIYTIWDGTKAATSLPTLPNVSTGDFKEDIMSYILMPNSIRDMLEHYVDIPNDTAHANDGYIYQSSYYVVESQYYTGTAYSIANGSAYISGDGGVNVYTKKYTK